METISQDNAKELLAVIKEFLAHPFSNTGSVRELFVRSLTVIKDIGPDTNADINTEHAVKMFFIIKEFVSHTEAVTEHQKKLLIRAFRILKDVHYMHGVDAEKVK